MLRKEKPWFEEEHVELASGDRMRRPKKGCVFCEECGTIAETWPDLTAGQIVESYKAQGVFTNVFEVGRQRLLGLTQRGWLPSVVSTRTMRSTSSSRCHICIPEASLNKEWKGQIKDVKESVPLLCLMSLMFSSSSLWWLLVLDP